MRKADMIIDLQFGSTGKGLIAGYLAMDVEYDVVVTANMPNAGHTFIDAMGNRMVHKVLPNGIVSPDIIWALIGPGAVFDPRRLTQEYLQATKYGYKFNVAIHPNSVPLTDKHVATEAYLGNIGSTKQGSSAAMIHKIMRSTEEPLPIAKVALREFQFPVGVYTVTNDDYMDIVESSNRILCEGAQGYSLGINEQFYPYCTSRDCSPSRFLSDMGVPHYMLNEVIGTARTYPIRVGGNSGPCYVDQEETTWGEIGVKPELTTVTQRERRVFTFSKEQIRKAMWQFGPDHVFLNFCNYLRTQEEFDWIKESFGNKLRWVGMGPTVNDVRTGTDLLVVSFNAY